MALLDSGYSEIWWIYPDAILAYGILHIAHLTVLGKTQDGKVTIAELYEALKDHLEQVPEAANDGWAGDTTGGSSHESEVGCLTRVFLVD